MIKLDNVSKYYHNDGIVTLALRKISLEFKIGEFVAITGESGSGKSTLLNVISGIDTYEDGELYINGDETSYYDKEDWERYRRDSISFIFQNFNLIDSYTVLKNVEVTLIIQGIQNKQERVRIAKEIIERVGLTSHLKHKASKLSGGQKQRLAIARALAKNTPVIVADEPTGNLDSESSRQVLELLHEISKDRLVLMVTHNYEAAQAYVTRKIRLFDGEVVEDKQIKPILSSECKTRPQFKMSKYLKALMISVNNLISQPKKSILLILVALSTVFFVFMAYGIILTSASQRSGHYNFINDYPERIILKRTDNAPLTEEDYQKISKINHVEKIIKEDLALDCRFSTDIVIDNYFKYATGYFANKSEFQNYIGRFPYNENEIFISLYLHESVREKARSLLNKQITVTYNVNRFFANKDFKIVGIHFSQEITSFVFHDDALSLIYDQLKITSKKYPAYVESILIDYAGIIMDKSLTGNKMVISRNLLWFDPNINITTGSLNGIEMEPVLDDSYKREGVIYVSEEIYNQLLVEEDYQYTVNVSDYKYAQKVMNRLNDLGYYSFSPYQVKDYYFGLDHIARAIQNFFLYFMFFLTFLVIYFLSYIVIKAIMFSKKRDYMIFRIIGAEQLTVKTISKFEIVFAFLCSYVLFFILFVFLVLIFPMFYRPIINIYEISDFILIIIINFVLSLLISRKFNKLLVKKSIYTNLRIEGE